ncbi:hypothetical protein LTR56_017454 [Elasticomyces elasticus]|nr:hypothetical protein LTR56_017454 [Elasticomyces elasticus]KAK3640866.1 hypothetical protein LTR22_016788 [Elasticomyces elasticus]KAK5759055.1 hypothetical protein LTS12_010827 [Elasticomyces elasticus]
MPFSFRAGLACAVTFSVHALAAPVAPCTQYITVDPPAPTSTPCTTWISVNSTKTASYQNSTVSVDPVATTPCTTFITLSSTKTASHNSSIAVSIDPVATTPCTQVITINPSTSALSSSAVVSPSEITSTRIAVTSEVASSTEVAPSTFVVSSAASSVEATGSLPTSFKWSSSGPLISAESGSGIDGIKDPSIVYYDGAYHVFASTAQESGYNMVYITFTDFADAGSASFYYLDQSPIGTGYRAAPEVFYFEPQKLWYLVYQNGNAAYSTNPDITDPSGWTAPKSEYMPNSIFGCILMVPTAFYSSEPAAITAARGSNAWVDMWVLCDTSDCYLFSSDDNGQLFRSSTSVADFPSGMGEPVVALEDSQYALFEASNVYSVGDGTYLLIVEAIGNDGNRYFRSWTSDSIDGTWTGLADTESNPFAKSTNVVFDGDAWTKSISHGEMVRTQVDQTLSISPCNLQYLYQGLDPTATGDYNTLPWSLGLLTQTNSAC